MHYPNPGQEDLDELLRQADALLSEEDSDYFCDDPLVPDGQHLGAIRNFNNNYGRGSEPEEPQPPAIPAYNQDYGQNVHYTREPAETPRREPEAHTPPPEKKKKKKKKKRRLWKVLLVLAILLGGLAVFLSTLLEQPMTDAPLGRRKKGAVTILLCGTDQDGTRTDTMMLLYLCAGEKAVNLVSLPRDTLTHTTSGKNAKLNSAFGRNNGREDPVEGMENLMLYVRDIIGYMPDGYLLIDLEGFVDVVDLMGGVKFDVPADMYYEDASQDLFIDLEKGMQTLNGYEAMGLVRFRKGYFNQDLGRVEVQRAFISACMDQWMKLSNIGKLPRVLDCLELHSTSDLSTGNLLWLAVSALRSGLGNVHTATLPGYAGSLSGSSYYILDPQGVADTVNQYCNPYVQAIDASDLTIVH